MSMRRARMRGSAVRWIEEWCVRPGGGPVRLSPEECSLILRITSGSGAQEAQEVISGPLAAYLTLFRLCGPEARPAPPGAPFYFATDVFTLWNAASPRLREFLVRRGEKVVCPALGTAWPVAA